MFKNICAGFVVMLLMGCNTQTPTSTLSKKMSDLLVLEQCGKTNECEGAFIKTKYRKMNSIFRLTSCRAHCGSTDMNIAELPSYLNEGRLREALVDVILPNTKEWKDAAIEHA